MHFNDLHIEIIQIIFYIHVYEHLGSKRTLLHTCRAWYNLASNDPILWKDITLVAWEGKYPLIDRCETLDDLVRNISRTRNGIFNLTLQLPAIPPDEVACQTFTANMDRKWPSRCRSLTLRTPASSDEDIGNQIQRTVDAILSPKRHQFTALEHLSIKDNLWGDALDGLLRRVGRSSLNLQSLELANTYPWEPCGIATRVFRHADIMRRIRRLQLVSVTVPVPWVEFTHLEHLDYTCLDVTVELDEPESPDSSNLSELVAPCLTSLCLEGEFGDIELPSHVIFNQLNHLVLRDFFAYDSAFPSSFPNLSSLGFQTRSYQISSPTGAAPGLEELTLAAYDVDLEEYDITTGKLTPRVLRLEIIPLQRNYIEFGRPLELWSRLEELHLTVRENVTFSLGRILERALCNERLPSSRRRWSPPDLVNGDPRLHTLTVLYPYTNEQGPNEVTKRTRVEQVRRILIKRHDSGLEPLGTVKVGWYKVARGAFLLGRPFTEWTVIEWRNCLDQWRPAD